MASDGVKVGHSVPEMLFRPSTDLFDDLLN